MSERFRTMSAVFVVLRNEKDEILLQQREGTGYLDGYWDLPSGHLEYGESIKGTGVREVLEEVGVTVEPEDLTLINIDQYFIDKEYINFTFAARDWQGEPRICEPEKCSAIGWFAVNALPEKCVNVVRVNEQDGFSDELTYAITTRESYESLMGEPFLDRN